MELLKKDLESKKINHAYLIECNDVLKGLNIAKDFAKGIFGIDSLDNNPDFYLINSEDKSIKIEQIRQMQKDINIKPIMYDNKVYIIDEADKMTEQSQNCLLKTLEEPPAQVVIILVTNSSTKLLGTIFSRVKRVRISDDIIETVSFNEAKELINNLNKLSKTQLLNYLTYFEENKGKINDILSYMQRYCNNLIEKIVLSDNIKSDNISIVRLAGYVEIINDTKIRLERNCNFNMTIDRMLMKMSE